MTKKRTFELSEEEVTKFIEWDKEHIKTCKQYPNTGAISGRLTFCFTPTGLGIATSVKCACGEEIDLTDYSTW